MILVDTGPRVGLFDPADAAHRRSRGVLTPTEEPLCTTVPVLTEAFHLLSPASIGSQRLMDFIAAGGLEVWFLDNGALAPARPS